jgi:hypothetical protein
MDAPAARRKVRLQRLRQSTRLIQNQPERRTAMHNGFGHPQLQMHRIKPHHHALRHLPSFTPIPQRPPRQAWRIKLNMPGKPIFYSRVDHLTHAMPIRTRQQTR